MKVKKRQYRSKRGRPLKKSKAKSKAKKGSKRRVKKMRGAGNLEKLPYDLPDYTQNLEQLDDLDYFYEKVSDSENSYFFGKRKGPHKYGILVKDWETSPSDTYTDLNGGKVFVCFKKDDGSLETKQFTDFKLNNITQCISTVDADYEYYSCKKIKNRILIKINETIQELKYLIGLLKNPVNLNELIRNKDRFIKNKIKQIVQNREVWETIKDARKDAKGPAEQLYDKHLKQQQEKPDKIKEKKLKISKNCYEIYSEVISFIRRVKQEKDRIQKIAELN
jgi:hypothetical protein